MELIKGIPKWITLATGVLLLLPAIFMGFDVCDAGFYLVFYDNFFSAPETVEYNFMYYLSGLFGAVWSWLCPSGGMIWMRIGGVTGVLCSVWMVLSCYDKFVSRRVAAVSTLCVVAAYAQSPLTLSYDIVSLLLLSGALTLFLHGLEEDGGVKMIAAGGLAAFALFARIPNVLFFGLIILVWFHRGIPYRRRMILSMLFAGGYVAGMSAVVGYMFATGDIVVFLSNLRTLADVSADGEASHGLGALVMAQVRYYLMVCRVAVKIGFIAVWCMVTGRIERTWIRRLLYLPAGIYGCYLMIMTQPTLIFGGAVLPALIVMSVSRFGGKGSDIVRVALFMALVFPCGSDSGGSNIGSILYLWGAPAAMTGWLRLRFRLSGTEYSLRPALIYASLIFFFLITLWKTYTGSLYFDSTPVSEMSGTIDKACVRGILTSKEKANVINELLPRLERYVVPGDTLFAYGSIPLVNYLTLTRPFVGCSWPEQLSASSLSGRLSGSMTCPVVCIQRFATIGSDWGNPSQAFVEGKEGVNVYHTSAKWVIVKDFLERKGYRRVDGTKSFDIYIPQSKDKNE